MNNTTGANLTIEETKDFYPLLDIEPNYVILSKVAAYAIVMATALVGNALIIVCYIKTKTVTHLHRTTINDCLILSLSCSDLLLPIFAVPERITRIYTYEKWFMMGPFGVIMCKLVNFNEAVSIVASLLTLNAIAIDRFMAVIFPFKRYLSKRGLRWLIVGIWFVAIAYNSPLFYYSSLVQLGENVVCNARTSMWDVKSWRHFYLVLSSITLLI
ncbi:hypothetical protein QZH41_006777 [Actinostola sp. cb2023]|nr:hypothetical protein QZH41_006777 [Actinostola sp. cb2023]